VEHGLPERAPLTDEVRVALLEDDFSSFGAWLARRRFDHDQMIGLIDALLAKRAMQPTWLGPRGPFWALLGCVGQTAFGGVALERVALDLGVVECYPVTLARELVATVPGLWRHGLAHSTGPDERPLALTTIFVGEDRTDGLVWQVFDAWMRGSSGLVLWSDVEIVGTPAGRARLEEAVRTVREIPWRRITIPRTAAVVHDADSTAASFLRDALLDGPTWPRRTAQYQRLHGSQEQKITTWMRILEDCGFEPGALPLATVCADCTSDFDLLVLPEVLVVDSGDIERLAAYVANGGTIVLDGSFGWVGRDGQPRDSGSLREQVSGQHPERVVDAPAGISGYLDSRAKPETRARMRSFVEGVAGIRDDLRRSSRHPGHPELVGEAARHPWLVRIFEWSGDELGLAMLPNYPTATERTSHLRDVPLDGIRAPAGFRLEWIHPPSGDTLRAGEAAVLRVTRASSDDPLPEPR
jgi:hypothetical protein